MKNFTKELLVFGIIAAICLGFLALWMAVVPNAIDDPELIASIYGAPARLPVEEELLSIAELVDNVLGMDFVLTHEYHYLYNDDGTILLRYQFVDLLGESFPIQHLERVQTTTRYATNTGDVIVTHFPLGRLQLHIDIGEASNGARHYFVMVLSVGVPFYTETR